MYVSVHGVSFFPIHPSPPLEKQAQFWLLTYAHSEYAGCSLCRHVSHLFFSQAHRSGKQRTCLFLSKWLLRSLERRQDDIQRVCTCSFWARIWWHGMSVLTPVSYVLRWALDVEPRVRFEFGLLEQVLRSTWASRLAMNMVYIGIWLVVHAAKRVIICNHKIYQYDLSPDPGSLSLEASFHGSGGRQVSFPHKDSWERHMHCIHERSIFWW